MSVMENTCRTCGKQSDQENNSDLCPVFNSKDYQYELQMVQQEFEMWNLNIAQNDGLPQKICLTCFDSFCQIHNFRMICQEAQTNFGELCTGLDIIIKSDPEYGDLDVDFPEDFEGEQTITVEEHYQFPVDELSKSSNLPVEQKTYEKLYERVNSDDESRKERDRLDALEELNAELPEFKKYQCEFCFDVIGFDDSELLNQHYNDLHASDLPYGCPKCEKCFDSKSKRNSHVRVHYRVVVNCTSCGKKVRGGKRMMAMHNELHHITKDRECPTCNKKFINITLKRLNYHMSWHDDTKLYKCKYCEKKFVQGTHLLVHERTHTGENSCLCTECGMGFKHTGALYTHMKIHGLGELTCTICSKTFFHPHGLRLHMQMHEQNRGKAHCDICHKSFTTAMSLRLHNHQLHGAPASQAIINVLSKRKIRAKYIKPYKCTKCPMSFVLHTQMERHLKVHDEYRPHTCNQCHKTFKRDAHLKLHVNSIHLNKKPHKCATCGWGFTQINHLKEHIASKHEDTRDFKCEVCGKAFATGKVLRYHMRKHTEKNPYKCTICKKSFGALISLKNHINTHLRKNEIDVAGGAIADAIIIAN